MRTKFHSEWDEILYLYDKVLEWFYAKGKLNLAKKYANRLEELLQQVASTHEAIKGEECWSLVYEIKGNLPKAIEYRQSEIKLMKKYMTLPDVQLLQDRDYDDIHDQLILLALLYQEAGDLKPALESLLEAKNIADTHGFVFEGQNLLDELQ